MKSTRCLPLLPILMVTIQGQRSCSGVNNNFPAPSSSGKCMTGWSHNNQYEYPDDFEGILNEVEINVCPESGKRIIKSNGIPDHTVTQGNPNYPCEINWIVSMPLHPEKKSTITEIPIRGIIGISINGVPAYGPQEGGSSNAVEPGTDSFITDAQFWYGHATPHHVWHLHNPFMGKANPTSDTLLGYALDGFPIYGPISDPNSLDSCNGRTIDGEYRYHVLGKNQVDETVEYCAKSPLGKNNWNYILGCYHGGLEETIVTDSTFFTLPEDCVREIVDPMNSGSPMNSCPISIVMSRSLTFITAFSLYLIHIMFW